MIVQCGCICHRGGIGDCSCLCNKDWGYSISPQKISISGYCHTVDPNQVKYELCKNQIIAQEHTINEMQRSIQGMEDRLEFHDITLEVKGNNYTDLRKKISDMKIIIDDVLKNNVHLIYGKKEEKPYENIFESKKTDQKGTDDIRHVKNALYDLYCWILDNVPGNKYRSNGIDLLEAAAMQLNKAISRRKENGTQDKGRHD